MSSLGADRAEDAKAGGGVGVELFLDDGERTAREVLREQGEQGAAQEREIGQGVGLTRPGAIFAPKDIALPMVADFHPGPVAADQRVPLRRTALGWLGTRQIEPAFVGGPAGGFDGALAAHDDQAAGEGEVGRERFEGEGVQAAVFDPAVAAGALEKKGVAGKASSACAWASNLG